MRALRLPLRRGLGLSVFVYALSGCELVVDANDYVVDGTTPSGASGTSAAAGGSVTTCPADMRPVVGGPSGNFCVDTYEVDAKAFADCKQQGQCPQDGAKVGQQCIPGTPGMPANCLTWEQANAYCASKGRRLPTEPEWKFAAVGTSGNLYPWGSMSPSDQACINRVDFSPGGSQGPCKLTDHPKDISVFDVFGMGGNVHEWTADQGKVMGDHVFKGGSWKQELYDVWNVQRSGAGHQAEDAVGFRCAVTLK
ncbi:MAG: SUMF1/EgtB/PvdO family nonheme iron enzyme [Deltaproteobacteria bacterium]|nr:SUMF1/EgtB/PvdO family nonheme iron enzyme [Deltaproteobacteria bacterium]